MKRLMLIVSILLLTACSSNKIPDGFNENDLNQKAEEIINLLNENNVDEVYAMFRTDVQAMIELEDLEVIIQDKFNQVGTFKEISQVAITDTKDPNTSEVYAVVIVSSDHEKGRTTYTLSFNKELEIVGFFIK